MSLATPILNFLAIDPGDVHQGTGYFEIDISYDVEEQKGKPTLVRHWTRDLNSVKLFKLVEEASVDALVIEEYRLYPELAREQGYSDFQTSQNIGVLKYICDQRGIPYFMQGASIKKKARRIGERLEFPGSIRMIGTGRGRYRGWDFGGPSQHERDATAHGVWWAFNHHASPIKDAHYKQQCRLIVGAG